MKRYCIILLLPPWTTMITMVAVTMEGVVCCCCCHQCLSVLFCWHQTNKKNDSVSSKHELEGRIVWHKRQQRRQYRQPLQSSIQPLTRLSNQRSSEPSGCRSSHAFTLLSRQPSMKPSSRLFMYSPSQPPMHPSSQPCTWSSIRPITSQRQSSSPTVQPNNSKNMAMITECVGDNDCDGRQITRHDQRKHDSAINKTMRAMLKWAWNLVCYSSWRENSSSE